MHWITLASLCLVPSAFAQPVYDFNSLTGSNPHPFTLLHGQDGWSEQTFNARNRCGVTATRSHDGTQSLRFQEVGPGYGCDASRINDASWSYPAFSSGDRNVYFQADVQIGYWGGSFGLAHDTDNSGSIRRTQAGERGVRFNVGTHSNVQLQLIPATGAAVRVPLSNIGAVSGGQWLRIRVVMDLTAAGGVGSGSVEVQNLTTSTTGLTPVSGLQKIPLGLNPTATDATNPALWDAVWLHFEGATYGLDNIEVGRNRARDVVYGDGCGSPSLGLRGVARPVIGTTGSMETFAIPSNTLAGFVLVGFRPIDPPLDLTSIGMTGCSLLVASDASIVFPPLGATVVSTLPIPNMPTLVGGNVYLQSAVIATGVNALGILTSNGLRWTLDTQ